jgi:histidine ammonia-lyase
VDSASGSPATGSNPAWPGEPQADPEEPLLIDGAHLACAQIRRVAAGPVPVRVTGAARARARASADLTQRVREQHRPLYGRGTGVGANVTVPVAGSAAEVTGLLLSHATGAGALRDPGRVRAMVVVRLNQLAAGGSGADPGLLDQPAEPVE